MENDNPVPLCENEKNNKSWDESETELVEDEDVAEYEEDHAGIKLTYKLKKEEIYKCLKHCDFFRERKKKRNLQFIILIILGLCFFISFFFIKSWYVLGFCVISFVFSSIVFLAPSIDLKNRVDSIFKKESINIEVYPDVIEINNKNKKEEIPLNNTIKFEEFEELMVLFLSNDNIFIIPERCIDPDYANDIQAMIISGTIPKEEE